MPPRSISTLVLLTVSIFLAVTADADTTRADSWQVEPFSVTYKVTIGPARARTTVALRSLGDNRFAVDSTTKVTGVVGWFKRGAVEERTTFRYENGEILAETLFRRDSLSADDRNIDIDYAPAAGTATVRYQAGETQVDIGRDTMNPLLMQIALMHHLATDRVPEAYTVLDYNGTEQFKISAGTKQWQRTPAGDFDAVPVDLRNTETGTGTRLWSASELQWLAVVVEARKDDEIKATLRLSERAP